MHEGPANDMVYAETGNLYDSGKQYRRAAHFFKLHIMANADTAYPGPYCGLVRLAAAYDWDSITSGA